MEREFSTINLGSIGDLNDSRIADQFHKALGDAIRAVRERESKRGSNGWAKSEIVLTLTVEGKSEEEGGSLMLGTTLVVKLPPLRSGAAPIQIVDGIPVVDVTPDTQAPLFSVAKEDS